MMPDGPLLHLSDTHFGTEQVPVVQALETLVRETAPALGVLSGDITQRATTSQFSAARAFIDRLAVPRWVVIAGNHDIPLFNLALRAVDPYRRFRAAFGAGTGAEIDLDDWLVLPLKTTRRYRHEDGEVSTAQIDATADRLRRARASNPGQLRIVVVHQPMVVPDAGDFKNLLHRAAEARVRWAEAGADIVLSGHIHLPCLLPMWLDAATGRALWSVQAGTAVSTRIRHGTANSVNLLYRDGTSTTGRGCRVERWDHDAASGRFRQGAVRQLNLAPASSISTPASTA